jgi:hypothetical protein
MSTLLWQAHSFVELARAMRLRILEYMLQWKEREPYFSSVRTLVQGAVDLGFARENSVLHCYNS